MTTKRKSPTAAKLTAGEFLWWLRALRIEPRLELSGLRYRCSFLVPSVAAGEVLERILDRFQIDRDEVATAMMRDLPRVQNWDWQPAEGWLDELGMIGD